MGDMSNDFSYGGRCAKNTENKKSELFLKFLISEEHKDRLRSFIQFHKIECEKFYIVDFRNEKNKKETE